MRLSLLTLLVFSIVSPVSAGNWPSWRGPNADGIAADGAYPTKWSPSENIVWKYELPGPGSSTPVVWDDRLFLTYSDSGTNRVLCLSTSGKRQWQTAIGDTRDGKHKKASGCNPSATTDGQHVYVYFKSGDLACLDFDGKVVWQKNLQDLYGQDTLWWDLGTSPVLTRELVVIACMHSGPSYLAGFDKGTGEVVWKQDRELGAPSEAAQSYTTPLVVSRGGQETIVVLGADHVTAHDAANGEELWRVGDMNPRSNGFFRSISSPVLAGDHVIAPYSRGGTLHAIRLGGEGDVTDTHVSWIKTGKGIAADVPTPAVLDGKIYVLDDRGPVSCIDAASGEVLWQAALEKNRNSYSSSPIVAGGHVYVTREDGATLVLKLGEQVEVVAKNELEELTVATPVFVDGRIYIRTVENLYCVGE